MTDDDLPPAYRLPDDDDTHPAHIYHRLIELPEHAHYKDEEMRVEFLMKTAPLIKAGKQVLGTMHIPTVQGRLKDLFEMLLAQFFGQMPQFLVTIDLEWWQEATPLEREALVYHELLHVKQSIDKNGDPAFDMDGNPKFGLVGHDIEAFNAEVERYGAWHPGIATFLAAAAK